MDEMLRKISAYPNGTFLRISWEYEGTTVEGVIDTIYETDNGLDEKEEGYQEFYACAVYVSKIIGNPQSRGVTVNSLIEISKYNQPTCIRLEDGAVIWKVG